MVFETDKSVLNTEVSSFQRLLSTQMWHLEQIKVSLIQWRPYRVGSALYFTHLQSCKRYKES